MKGGGAMPGQGSIQLPPLHEERLENGVTVVVARRPGVPLVAVRIVISAGASLDPPRGHGLANLVAQVARRGTARRTGREIDDRIESLGSELGAGSDEDATYFGLSAPAEFLSELLDVVADVATGPTFPAAEWRRIRRREVAGLAHVLDEPGAVADRAMIDAVYRGHPYGHPTDGRARHIEALHRADAVAFHRRWFAPASTTLVIVGAVDPEEALAQARRRLGRWRAAGGPAPAIPAPPAVPRSVLVVDKGDVTQTQVRVASPALARATREYFPALVANAIFGGGFTSRLMEAVRVNRGLSYGVRSRFAMSRAAGIFFVASFTKVETTAELLQVVLDEAERFCAEGPSEEELGRAQSYLAGLYPLSLETHDQVAEKLADVKLYGIPLDEITGYRERVRAVTAEQCREIARRHFPLDRGVIVAVGPAKRVAPALERFGPVSVVPARKTI
ncbi:MAG TPA: pitrilysin family protein [Anaeromyxobacteraceae bacterium]